MTRPPARRGVDCLVIGAGVFGLWAARHAIQRGERVLVVEKRQVGAGASGGFLGALMPHMPERWNAKKQMQFEALTGLDAAVGALEADTGKRCGFRRTGRLVPLTGAHMRAHAAERIEGAARHWHTGDGRQYAMRLIEPPFTGTLAAGWLKERAAPFGALYDDLSARIDPRAYLAALAAFVRVKGALLEGVEVTRVEPAARRVLLADGRSISAGRIIIANGVGAYPLLAGLDARYRGRPITGRAVRGQAVLIAHQHDDDRPILYDNGAYVVPHDNGRIAIGASSHDREPVEPAVFDPDDMDFYRRALDLAEGLDRAPISEHWVNWRPRNTFALEKGQKPGADPLTARLDGPGDIYAAVGGFKIGLAVAHHLTADPDRPYPGAPAVSEC